MGKCQRALESLTDILPFFSTQLLREGKNVQAVNIRIIYLTFSWILHWYTIIENSHGEDLFLYCTIF